MIFITFKLFGMKYAVIFKKQSIINLCEINNKNELEFFVMGTDNNNNYTGPERRVNDRREVSDRRDTTRFSDILGRRSGVERRLPIR